MYSLIEMDENYKVEEISSNEMMSIISLQNNNNSISCMEKSSNTELSNNCTPLSQRLSEFANTPLPDWLLKKV